MNLLARKKDKKINKALISMRLKEYLYIYKEKQYTFAEKIGVSPQVLIKILKKGYDPKASLIEKIRIATKGRVGYRSWIKK